MLEERDPVRQPRLTARNSRVVKERVGGLFEVIRSGATTDPDVAALWSRIEADFHDNQRAIVESLHGKGALGARLDVERAADILWALNHPDVWRLLVGERTWTPDEWEQWFGDIAVDRLLKPPLARPRKRR